MPGIGLKLTPCPTLQLICTRCNLSAQKAEANGCGTPGCARQLPEDKRFPPCPDCGFGRVRVDDGNGTSHYTCHCRPY